MRIVKSVIAMTNDPRTPREWSDLIISYSVTFENSAAIIHDGESFDKCQFFSFGEKKESKSQEMSWNCIWIILLSVNKWLMKVKIDCYYHFVSFVLWYRSRLNWLCYQNALITFFLFGFVCGSELSLFSSNNRVHCKKWHQPEIKVKRLKRRYICAICSTVRHLLHFTSRHPSNYHTYNQKRRKQFYFTRP